MRRNTKIISLLIVLSLIGIFIYKSPDEAYWFKENPQDAIKIGRTYAYYLLNSYKQGLLKMSIDPAKTKIEKSNFHQIAISEIRDLTEKKKIIAEITAPLLAEQGDEDMELIILEKLESFIVMTFAYKSWEKIVEIPGKGKMLFSVGVRYYNPIDNRIALKLVRKIANLPLLRNFTGRMGTTGRWVVIDYNYKYNLNDYFDWVLKEGDNYSQKKLNESEELMRQLNSKELLEKFRKELTRGLDFLYGWGSATVENQIEYIEELYRVPQEVEKNSELRAE